MKENRKGIVIDANGTKVGIVERLPSGENHVRLSVERSEIQGAIRLIWLDMAPDLADYPAMVIA